jgi:hypothetical protein
MQARFAGGVLHSTDYFSSRDHDEGRAWLVVHACDWHVLLPHLPACNAVATAGKARFPSGGGPRPARHRLPGTRRLALALGTRPAGTCRCPRRQILSQRPLLPQPYTHAERTLSLYTRELKASSNQSFFGSVQRGLQIFAPCRLWLVRDTRHGEKPKDIQRRLQRFREQRPGGL